MPEETRLNPETAAIALPGVWDDVGDGWFARSYNDDTAWIEARWGAQAVEFRAKRKCLVAGVMLAVIEVARMTTQTLSQCAVDRAVAQMEAALVAALNHTEA